MNPFPWTNRHEPKRFSTFCVLPFSPATPPTHRNVLWLSKWQEKPRRSKVPNKKDDVLDKIQPKLKRILRTADKKRLSILGKQKSHKFSFCCLGYFPSPQASIKRGHLTDIHPSIFILDLIFRLPVIYFIKLSKIFCVGDVINHFNQIVMPQWKL